MKKNFEAFNLIFTLYSEFIGESSLFLLYKRIKFKKVQMGNFLIHINSN